MIMTVDEEFFLACEQDDIRRAEKFLNLMADINYKKNGETALGRSIFRINPVTALFLIDNGADLNTHWQYGHTPLMMIVGSEKVELLSKALLFCDNIDAQNEFGTTALMIAVERCFVEGINLLLDNGASLNIVNNKGCSALDLADNIYYEEENKEYIISILEKSLLYLDLIDGTGVSAGL